MKNTVIKVMALLVTICGLQAFGTVATPKAVWKNNIADGTVGGVKLDKNSNSISSGVATITNPLLLTFSSARTATEATVVMGIKNVATTAAGVLIADGTSGQANRSGVSFDASGNLKGIADGSFAWGWNGIGTYASDKAYHSVAYAYASPSSGNGSTNYRGSKYCIDGNVYSANGLVYGKDVIQQVALAGAGGTTTGYTLTNSEVSYIAFFDTALSNDDLKSWTSTAVSSLADTDKHVELAASDTAIELSANKEELTVEATGAITIKPSGYTLTVLGGFFANKSVTFDCNGLSAEQTFVSGPVYGLENIHFTNVPSGFTTMATATGIYLKSKSAKPTELLSSAYLWLDASDTDKITKDDSNVVSSWASENTDGKTASTYTAGNVSAAGPTYTADALNGKAVLDFGDRGSGKDLSFDRSTSVRAVFMVADIASGSFILGDSTNYDYHRNGNNYYHASNAAANVRNGKTYHNGILVSSPTSTTLPTGYGLVEIITAGDTAASYICQDRNCSDSTVTRTGGKKVAELIVLTSEPSEADRLTIETYLMNKWGLSYDNYTAYVSGDTTSSDLVWSPDTPYGLNTEKRTVDVTADATLTMASMTAGTFAVSSDEGDDLTLAKATDAELSIGTYDFSSAVGKVTVNYSTDTAAVKAGTDTVLNQSGTGTLTVGSGKKATFANGVSMTTTTVSAGGEVRYNDTTAITSTKITTTGAIVSYKNASFASAIGDYGWILKLEDADDTVSITGQIQFFPIEVNDGTLTLGGTTTEYIYGGKANTGSTTNSVITLNGGKIDCTGITGTSVSDTSVSDSKNRGFIIGCTATGTIPQRPSLVMNGGTFDISNGVLAPWAYCDVNVNGGLLKAKGINKGDGSTETNFRLNGGRVEIGSVGFGNRTSKAFNIYLKGGALVATDTLTTKLAATLGGSATMAANSGKTLTHQAVLSGDGALVIGTSTDTGTVYLKGANKYTGGTTVAAGTLKVDDVSMINNGPVTVKSGATLNILTPPGDSDVTVKVATGLFTVENGATVQFNGTAISSDWRVSGSYIMRTALQPITVTPSSAADWSDRTLPTSAYQTAVTVDASFGDYQACWQTLGGRNIIAPLVIDSTSTVNVYGLGGYGRKLASLDKDIYLIINGGTYNLVVGAEDASWGGNDSTSTKSDVLVGLSGSAKANFVMGAGYRGGNNATVTGHTGVTIEGESVVYGSVYGGWTTAHNGTPKVTGNTSVLIKNVQSQNNTALTLDGTTALGVGKIIGGSAYQANSGSASQIGGNSSVTIDLGDTASGLFDKLIIGGSYDRSGTSHSETVKGNSSVTISAPSGVTFTQIIAGGGSGTGTSVEGNAAVVINGGTYTNVIYAGAANSGTVGGTATITVNGGTFNDGTTYATFNGGAATGLKKLVINQTMTLNESQITSFGQIEVTEGHTLTINSTSTRRFGAQFTGAGNVTFTGDGAVTLDAAPSLTGTITVQGGTVDFLNAVLKATVSIASGKTVNFTRDAADVYALTLAGFAEGTTTSQITINSTALGDGWEISGGSVGKSAVINAPDFFMVTNGVPTSASQTFAAGMTVETLTNNYVFVGLLGGAYVNSGVPLTATPTNHTVITDGCSYQFQTMQGAMLKAVVVAFTDDTDADNNSIVNIQATGTGYKESGGKIGDDCSGGTSQVDSPTGNGYCAMDVMAIRKDKYTIGKAAYATTVYSSLDDAKTAADASENSDKTIILLANASIALDSDDVYKLRRCLHTVTTSTEVEDAEVATLTDSFVDTYYVTLTDSADDIYWKETSTFYWNSDTQAFNVYNADGTLVGTTTYSDGKTIVFSKKALGTKADGWPSSKFGGKTVRVDSDMTFHYADSTANIFTSETVSISSGATLTLDNGNSYGNVVKVLDGASFSGAGTLKISGNAVFNDCTINAAVVGNTGATIEIPSGETVTIGTSGSLSSVTLTGAGTLSFTSAPSAPGCTFDESWTGTVVLPDIVGKINVDTYLNQFGVSGSVVQVGNIGGETKTDANNTYFTGGGTVTPTICIPSDKTFYLNNGNSDTKSTFTKLTGAGTLSVTFKPSDSTKPYTLAITTLDNFTGTLSQTGANAHFTIGTCVLASTPAENDIVIKTGTINGSFDITSTAFQLSNGTNLRETWAFSYESGSGVKAVPATVEAGGIKYGSLDAAVAAANGAPIKLLKEIGTYSPSGNVTFGLDVSSYGLTINTTSGQIVTLTGLTGSQAVTVTGAGTVVIADSGDPLYTGTLTVEAGAALACECQYPWATSTATSPESGTVASVVVKGTLVLNHGAYTTGIALNQVTWETGSKLALVDSVYADGRITVNNTYASGTPSSIEVTDTAFIALDNVTKKEYTGYNEYTYTPRVSGSACLLDFTFTNDTATVTSTSAGGRIKPSSTCQLNDADHYFQFAANSTAYYTNAVEVSAGVTNYTALMMSVAPWRGQTEAGVKEQIIPTDGAPYTVAFAATFPRGANTCIFACGSAWNSLFLATGTDANHIQLIRSKSSEGNYNVPQSDCTLLTTMNVPYGDTAQHTIVFETDDHLTFNIYVDGTRWTTYTFDSEVDVGTGWQIGGWAGGGVVGYNKADAAAADATDAYVSALRLYDGAMGTNAIALIAKEFPYKSPAVSYDRLLTTADTAWKQIGKWVNKTNSTEMLDQPLELSRLVITNTTSGVVTLAVNLVQDVEALEFQGLAGSIKLAAGTGKLTSYSTVHVATDMTIEYGSLDISEVPVTIADGKKLTYDMSDVDMGDYYVVTTNRITGVMTAPAGNDKTTWPFQVTFPTTSLRYDFDYIYREADHSYCAVLTPNQSHIEDSQGESNGYLALNDSSHAIISTVTGREFTLPAGVTKVSVYNGNTDISGAFKTFTEAEIASGTVTPELNPSGSVGGVTVKAQPTAMTGTDGTVSVHMDTIPGLWYAISSSTDGSTWAIDHDSIQQADSTGSVALDTTPSGTSKVVQFKIHTAGCRADLGTGKDVTAVLGLVNSQVFADANAYGMDVTNGVTGIGAVVYGIKIADSTSGDFSSNMFNTVTFTLKSDCGAHDKTCTYYLKNAKGVTFATATSSNGTVTFANIGSNQFGDGSFYLTTDSTNTYTMGIASYQWGDGEAIVVNGATNTVPLNMLANTPYKDGLVSKVTTCTPDSRIDPSNQNPGSVYRIPAVAKGAKSIVAMFDCRYYNHHDLGVTTWDSVKKVAIDQAECVSTDGGETWTKPEVVIDVANYSSDTAASAGGTRRDLDIGDPCIGYLNGTFYMMAETGAGLQNGWVNQDLVVYKRAEDSTEWIPFGGANGERSVQAAVSNAVVTAGETWPSGTSAILQGPGHAITFTTNGTECLLFPMQLFDKSSGSNVGRCFATWTDGTSWWATKLAPTGDDSQENSIAVLDNGYWYMMCKDGGNSGKNNDRLIYVSTNHVDWTKVAVQFSGETPGVQGSLLKVKAGTDTVRGKYVACMCTGTKSDTTINGSGRKDIKLFYGTDTKLDPASYSTTTSATQPITWCAKAAATMVYEGTTGAQGYTSLTLIDDNHVGILFEANKHIYFKIVDISAYMTE